MSKFRDSHEIKIRGLLVINQALAALGFDQIASLPRGHIGCPIDCSGSNAFATGTPQPVELCSNSIAFQVRGDALAVASAWRDARKYRLWGPRIQLAYGVRGTDVYKVRVPRDLSRFVFHFDQGDFPELVSDQSTHSASCPFVRAQDAIIQAGETPFSIHPTHADIIV